MPEAWDVSATGAKAGSGGCLTDSAADGWAKCKAVYTYMNAQNKDTATYATNPLWQVVDGPFKLTSYNVAGNYTFVPNATYSGSPKASIAELKFQTYTSDTAIYTALKTGALSTGGPNGAVPSTDLPPAGAGFVPPSNPLASAGYVLQPSYQFAIGYAYINFNNPTYGPVFKQLYFRQAMQMLDNQAGMSKAVGRGYAYPTELGRPAVPEEPVGLLGHAAERWSGPVPVRPDQGRGAAEVARLAGCRRRADL